ASSPAARNPAVVSSREGLWKNATGDRPRRPRPPRTGWYRPQTASRRSEARSSWSLDPVPRPAFYHFLPAHARQGAITLSLLGFILKLRPATHQTPPPPGSRHTRGKKGLDGLNHRLGRAYTPGGRI